MSNSIYQLTLVINEETITFRNCCAMNCLYEASGYLNGKGIKGSSSVVLISTCDENDFKMGISFPKRKLECGNDLTVYFNVIK